MHSGWQQGQGVLPKGAPDGWRGGDGAALWPSPGECVRQLGLRQSQQQVLQRALQRPPLLLVERLLKFATRERLQAVILLLNAGTGQEM